MTVFLTSESFDEMPRMHIPGAAEQTCFEHPLVFDSTERKKYLDFPGFVVDVAKKACAVR